MNPIPYGRQDISQDDIAAVVAALQHPYLTQGPKVTAFEEAFADYIGSKYAVAVANGTAALHLCAMAMNVSEETNVITSPITFAATANCIRYCGGNVYFADIDPDTLLLDIEKVKELLDSKPAGFFSGILPVDFAGYPVDLEAFRRLAADYGLWIIEDACHAPGAFIDNEHTAQRSGDGQFAELAIFSFHPVKHIAAGEGGMITTNERLLYERLKMLRTHGITKDPNLLHENQGGWYYEMQELGYNYRLTDIQCALGLSQLQRAPAGIERRRAIARRYDEAFKGSSVKTIQAAEGIGHAYHLYIIQVNNRKELYDALREHQIYAQVHYIPVHRLPYYRKLPTTAKSLPHAEAYYERGLSLPMFPALTDTEQDYVIEKVLEFAR
jgi:UDP-4-amino-4,6-dideoxy-N-acetyl-beta-L-altrosamine transaminase